MHFKQKVILKIVKYNVGKAESRCEASPPRMTPRIPGDLPTGGVV